MPILTPLHVSSSSETLNRAIYKSLVTIAEYPPADNGDTFTIIDANDTFHVQYLSSALDSMQNISQSLNGYSRSNSADPIPKRIFFHATPMTYQYFSPKEYFRHLLSSSEIGQSLAYVDLTTSTQTLLDKNPAFLRTLPSGFVIVAASQLNGRGRSGNAWISPRGSLVFSYILRLPLRLSCRLVFVQYLVSLAVVEGIRTYSSGWEIIDVSLKWPNDIYGKSKFGDRWEKIGGIIVNSTYLENEYVLVIGTFFL